MNKEGQLDSKIKAPVINLLSYLRKNSIKKVDMYISNIQGVDLMVLKTLNTLIDEKHIVCIETEAAKDKFGNVYEGLPDISLKSFQELAGDNYNLVSTGCGTL